MPSFRHRVLPVVAIPVLAISFSACHPLCPEMNDIWVGTAYSRDLRRWKDGVYESPANAWVDNPKMAAFVRDSIEGSGVKWLSIQYGFACAPKPGGDCPDCFVCTVSRGGVVNVVDQKCQSDGDLFVRAEIGPGTSVRAMTCWRR